MESKYWGQEEAYKNGHICVSCGKPMLTEDGQICSKCRAFTAPLAEITEPSKPNTELSFGAGDGSYDFLVYYRRAKPLNRFQIWMYKVCFGIRARNI